jgi:hypothetical protein
VLAVTAPPTRRVCSGAERSALRFAELFAINHLAIGGRTVTMATKNQATARGKFAKLARSKHKGSAVGRAAASTTKPKKKAAAQKTATNANRFE